MQGQLRNKRDSLDMKMRKRFAIPALLIILISTLLACLSFRGNWDSTGIFNSVVVEDGFGNQWPENEDVPPGEISMYYQFDSFDAENQLAFFFAYPWPVNDYGTPYFSSVITKVPIRVFVDTISPNGMTTYSVGDVIGGIPMHIDAYNPLHLRSEEHTLNSSHVSESRMPSSA